MQRVLPGDGSPPSRSGQRAFLVLAALPLLAMTVTHGTCDVTTVRVEVEQPIAFNHQAHVQHFRSRQHGTEQLRRHLKLLEMDEEDAADMNLWTCKSCHKPGDKPQCDGCHMTLLQDSSLIAREGIRPCVGCHQQAWSGAQATIPSIKVCRACHEQALLTENPEEQRLRHYFEAGRDVPWLQINTTAPHVHFSHVAHVRLGGMACDACHGDMSQLATPPATVNVFSMDACVQCHQRNHASTDCLVCHH